MGFKNNKWKQQKRRESFERSTKLPKAKIYTKHAWDQDDYEVPNEEENNGYYPKNITLVQ